jgi:inhibitor of cysteine peptidase
MQLFRLLFRFAFVRWPFLVALLAIACIPQTVSAENKVVTDADKGGEVHLKVGDTLEVRLKANPTTGFMWFIHKESTPLLKLVHQTMTEPTDQSAGQNVGRPVFQVYNFEPRRAGDGVLKLHYVRSWEAPKPAEEQFTIHVFIE